MSKDEGIPEPCIWWDGGVIEGRAILYKAPPEFSIKTAEQLEQIEQFLYNGGKGRLYAALSDDELKTPAKCDRANSQETHKDP